MKLQLPCSYFLRVAIFCSFSRGLLVLYGGSSSYIIEMNRFFCLSASCTAENPEYTYVV